MISREVYAYIVVFGIAMMAVMVAMVISSESDVGQLPVLTILTSIHFIALFTMSIMIWITYSKQDETEEEKQWRVRDLIMNIITFIFQTLFLLYALYAYFREIDVDIMGFRRILLWLYAFVMCILAFITMAFSI